LDLETIAVSVSKTKAAVIAENHSIIGGLGGAVADAGPDLRTSMGNVAITKGCYGNMDGPESLPGQNKL
jgi:transketolase C-terminal domain/subunit